MTVVRDELKERFSKGRTIPGTRGYHYFSPSSDHEILYKQTADEKDFKGCFSITGKEGISGEKLIPNKNEYIACFYDSKWWVGLVIDVSIEEQDCQVSFMHPLGPKRKFRWPVREDLCWVPFENIICKIRAPVTATGRSYDISKEDEQFIIKTAIK